MCPVILLKTFGTPLPGSLLCNTLSRRLGFCHTALITCHLVHLFGKHFYHLPGQTLGSGNRLQGDGEGSRPVSEWAWLGGCDDFVFEKTRARTMRSTAWCVRWQCAYTLCLAGCSARGRPAVFRVSGCFSARLWGMAPCWNCAWSTSYRGENIWFLHLK